MDPLLAGGLVVALAVGGGVGFYFLLVSQARRALNAHVVLQGREAPLRGVLPVQVHVRPRQEVRIDRAVARTICRRRVLERQRDGDQHVEVDEVARAEVEFLRTHTFRPGHPESFELDVPVADGLPTDRAGKLTIHWTLEVHFAVSDFPDAVWSLPIRVVRRIQGPGPALPRGSFQRPCWPPGGPPGEAPPGPGLRRPGGPG